MTTEARELTPRRDRRPVRWLDVKRGSVRVSTATKEGVRAVRDVRHLLRFRMSGLRGRSRRAVPIAFVVLTALTLLFAFAPAFLPAYQIPRRDVLLLLPTAYVSVLVVSIVSAAASGGGRELLPRDYAVVFPVSPTTDHLGALLMAPLNIAWLLQAMVAARHDGLRPRAAPLLPLALVPVASGWSPGPRWRRSSPGWSSGYVAGRAAHGRRSGCGGAVGGAGRLDRRHRQALGLARRESDLPHPRRCARRSRRPVVRLGGPSSSGWAGSSWSPWSSAPGWPDSSPASRRATSRGRDLAARGAVEHPASDFVALLRTDRAGIWRSVPMRRGMVVLAACSRPHLAAGRLVRVGPADDLPRAWWPPVAFCCSA